MNTTVKFDSILKELMKKELELMMKQNTIMDLLYQKGTFAGVVGDGFRFPLRSRPPCPFKEEPV